MHALSNLYPPPNKLRGFLDSTVNLTGLFLGFLQPLEYVKANYFYSIHKGAVSDQPRHNICGAGRRV